VPDNKPSAREAALIALARAELGKNPGVHADPAGPPPGSPAAQRDMAQRSPGGPIAGSAGAAPVRLAERTASAGVIQVVTLGGKSPAPATDPAQRAAALMALARAENELNRRRRRQLYVWVPLAFVSAIGLWMLLWMWLRL